MSESFQADREPRELRGAFMNVDSHQANNPLHGWTLEKIVGFLVDHYGWVELGRRIKIRCFTSDPSVKSSLKFLRKTPWARKRSKTSSSWFSRDKPKVRLAPRVVAQGARVRFRIQFRF